jgi:hypothetical protein
MSKILCLALTVLCFSASAFADILCVKYGPVCRPNERCTIKAATAIKSSTGSCPSGYKKAFTAVSEKEIDAKISSIAAGPKGEKGDPGPKGDTGPKGDPGAPGKDGVTLTQVETAIDTRLLEPVFYVTYDVGFMTMMADEKRVVAFGQLKLLPDASWKTRVVVRGQDKDPTLENSPVICSSFWAKTNGPDYSGTGCSGKFEGYPVSVWFVPPTSGHTFPLLRGMVGGFAGEPVKSCAQHAVEYPSADNINEATTCPFGARYVSVVLNESQVSSTPPTVPGGTRFAADQLTADKLCVTNGFMGAWSYTRKSYDSCSDNHMKRWNGSAWSTIGACSYNSGITSLTCYKLAS